MPDTEDQTSPKPIEPPSTQDSPGGDVTHPTVRIGDLDPTECLFLLRWATVGRVAVAGGEGPTVVPVSFVLDRDTVVFQVQPGALARLLEHQPVSFEADGVDPNHHLGWTVLVQGLALEIDDDPDLEPAAEPWSPMDGHVTLRLTPGTITGHRYEMIHSDDEPCGYL
jgi:uncharacterized protein